MMLKPLIILNTGMGFFSKLGSMVVVRMLDFTTVQLFIVSCKGSINQGRNMWMDI